MIFHEVMQNYICINGHICMMHVYASELFLLVNEVVSSLSIKH